MNPISIHSGHRPGLTVLRLLAGILGLWAAFAFAASPAQPTLELAVHKVVAAQGRQPEKLTGAELARAGDTLEYETVYLNSTSKTVRDAEVTLPIPANGVEYLIDTATPGELKASTDGKRFSALPLMRTERGADGKPVQRPAPAADYRFLRWDLGDLKPGASRTVRARVRLLPVGSAQ